MVPLVRERRGGREEGGKREEGKKRRSECFHLQLLHAVLPENG